MLMSRQALIVYQNHHMLWSTGERCRGPGIRAHGARGPPLVARDAGAECHHDVRARDEREGPPAPTPHENTHSAFLGGTPGFMHAPSPSLCKCHRGGWQSGPSPACR